MADGHYVGLDVHRAARVAGLVVGRLAGPGSPASGHRAPRDGRQMIGPTRGQVLAPARYLEGPIRREGPREAWASVRLRFRLRLGLRLRRYLLRDLAAQILEPFPVLRSVATFCASRRSFCPWGLRANLASLPIISIDSSLCVRWSSRVYASNRRLWVPV